MPFGAAQSPAISCEIAQASAVIFSRLFQAHSLAVQILVYVDDYLLIAHSHADLVAAYHIMNYMNAEAAELGLEFNQDKDVGFNAPRSQLEFLGILIRAEAGDLLLPPEKRVKYLSKVEEFSLYHQGLPHVPREPLTRLA